MGVKTFRDLLVWQKSHLLVLEVYKITKGFPSEEKFGLISQLRRSVCSIATNIVVEGRKRKSRKDYSHFLNLADSSLEEAKYHLLLARDLGYFRNGDYENLLELSDEIGKMLFGLKKALIS